MTVRTLIIRLSAAVFVPWNINTETKIQGYCRYGYDVVHGSGDYRSERTGAWIAMAFYGFRSLRLFPPTCRSSSRR